MNVSHSKRFPVGWQEFGSDTAMSAQNGRRFPLFQYNESTPQQPAPTRRPGNNLPVGAEMGDMEDMEDLKDNGPTTDSSMV